MGGQEIPLPLSIHRYGKYTRTAWEKCGLRLE